MGERVREKGRERRKEGHEGVEEKKNCQTAEDQEQTSAQRIKWIWYKAYLKKEMQWSKGQNFDLVHEGRRWSNCSNVPLLIPILSFTDLLVSRGQADRRLAEDCFFAPLL